MIKCENLTFKYGKQIIFENLNYTFDNNKICAIVGKSGVGKTTLLRCIAGLNEPYMGRVIYVPQNTNPFDEKCKEIITKPDSRIFMMHQHHANFPWLTCYDNIMFPCKLNGIDKSDSVIDLKIHQLLKDVGLEEYADKYPGELSGGMNQRLALARTLIMEPKVLLMDEPMSALDSITRSKMQEIILKMHEKTKNTIILITHDINEAKKMGDTIIEF